MEGLPGDISCAFAHQKRNSSGDISGLPKAAQGNIPFGCFEPALIQGPLLEAKKHPSLNHTDGNRIRS